MSTHFSHLQQFPADPATVLALLRNPEYVRAKGERTGGRDVEVTVEDGAEGGVTITSHRTMPADVPSYARSFVGDSLTVTEVQVWSAPDADGSATASVTVDFHAPITYTGTIRLTPDAQGSAALNEGTFTASVPFVGGKVEKVAAEQTQRYLAKEESVAQEWLAG